MWDMGDSYGRLKERIGTPVNSFGTPSSNRLYREILDILMLWVDSETK